MTSSHRIVLGLRQAGIPANAAAEAERAGRHWRRWRQGGVAISFALHGILALMLAATLPQFGAEARKDVDRSQEPLPVEIVERAPEADPPKKEEKKAALPEPKAPLPVPEPPKFDSEKQPDAAKPVPPPPQRAPAPAAKAEPAPAPKPPEKAAPTPEPKAPAAPAAPPLSPARPSFAWTAPAPPPVEAEPPADLGARPRAAPAPGEGLKLEADVVALPDDKNKPDKETQYWVLEPLRIDLGNGCGPVVITGTMALTERISDGVFRGSIQTTTRPVQPARHSRCLAQSSLYRVEVRFAGAEVMMLGDGGFSDRGVQRNGVMMLEDAYGRSIWRRR